ncbi:prolyl oligopeptidase family serine peptidase [Microbacterium sp. cx-59]|uniref:prolyl oligopeptidase family serine peptidase n=1 Tax=Microbacterium sp. cx-59 TaxID=2891207 RepID=UPI001E3E6B22|nr:prolyl oligopeptidase family serine peptidase [Microbacterium sp. cx-59]MCC4909764.1 prolyl oligopeptidase family serine peptidase [Microbacterium sp. cx-59]
MESTLPYGSWPSPLTAAAVASASARFDGARFVAGDVWWAEGVPAEEGRTAVRRRRGDGTVEDVLRAPWSARSRVHEYGGGAWTASDDGVLFFVDGADQRVRAVRLGEEPETLTPPVDGAAYGGLTWQHGSLLAVREQHLGARTPARSIVRIDPDGGGVEELATGSDFLAQPALSPDGTRLAWIGWDHPAMPWDQTTLRVATLDGESEAIALTDGGSSAVQPVWLDNDTLLFSDDRDGRWNLRRASLAQPRMDEAVAPADADTGGALWVLGTRWFASLPDGRIVAVRTHGADELVVIEPSSGSVRPLGIDATASASIEDVDGTRVLLIAAGRTATTGVWLVDVDDPGNAVAIAGAGAAAGPEWTPVARHITVDGPHGEVHAFAYPPTNPEVTGDDDELPPYLVWVHGGPTSHVGPSASAKIAYWTSRGVGVLDVNYGGSTGYGRAYRERLKGQWGVVDVDDVVAAASGLAAAGLADPARLAIEGGSAGGWTVLAALVGSDTFAAGVSRYGVGDARALAADTHDFEARYLDGLIGPLPEAEHVYLERSPLSRPDRFRVPLLILQGAEDRVVPPSQAEAIRDALRERGVPHAYVLYEGEGHGFRRAETSVHALESELAFLGRVFGFETPDVPPFELTIGSLTVASTAVGREIVVVDEVTANAARDLAVIVSREPVRPLFAHAVDADWAQTLSEHGFTEVDPSDLPAGSASPYFVLPPTLDGD